MRPRSIRDGKPTPGADELLESWGAEGIDSFPLGEERLRNRPTTTSSRRERSSAARRPTVASSIAAPRENATVVMIARGPCTVELADGSLALAQLPKRLARDAKSEIVVGDRLLIVRRSSGEWAVDSVLPRTNRLSRPDPHHSHRECVLAANLDLALIVVSIRRPPLSTGLVDRFLVALARGGIAAALVVNKLDLLDGETRQDPELLRLEPYRRLGLSVVLCSTLTGLGLDELVSLVAQRTVAFFGASGVGKSSLVNALFPAAAAAAGELSSVAPRGRHTTSRARSYRVDGGTRIVDTPGIREFGLSKMTASALSRYFDDFASDVEHCRFSNCSHRHEPSCAVRLAVAEGRISSQRYATYLRILGSFDEE